VKISELAKKVKIPSKMLLIQVVKLGISAKSAQAILSDAALDKVLKMLAKKKPSLDINEIKESIKSKKKAKPKKESAKKPAKKKSETKAKAPAKKKPSTKKTEAKEKPAKKKRTLQKAETIEEKRQVEDSHKVQRDCACPA